MSEHGQHHVSYGFIALGNYYQENCFVPKETSVGMSKADRFFLPLLLVIDLVIKDFQEEQLQFTLDGVA